MSSSAARCAAVAGFICSPISNGSPIAGNLDGWPDREAQPGNFVEFDYQRRIGGELETRRARGRVFALMGGFQLLVARDVHERYETERLLTTTLPWSVGLMLLLGLVGGALMSRNLLARLDSINRTSREIMAGDLSRRVPVTGSRRRIRFARRPTSTACWNASSG